MTADERQPVSIFLPTYLVLSAGVCNAFLAGDLFNLFVGFEVLLAASFVLLTIGASTERVRVGISYVMVSMVSSMIFLIGIALIYAATGTLNMAELAVRLDGVSAGTRSALFAVLLVAFGIKAAVFPLSTWLPDSYPTAPAPVTAVFAGLLTKVGVYAIIRAHTLLFPSGGLDQMLMVAAFLTMLVGILGAIAQSDIKRLLSFTLVSHIGYMVFGIALSSELGLVGRDLLRRAPHPGADDAVPGRRPDRAAGGRVDAAAPRRTGGGEPAAGVRVRRARAQSRWHPAVFRVHRQGRTAGGRRPERFGAGLDAGRRQRGDQPADAVRDVPRLDPGVLAAPRRRPRGPCRRRRLRRRLLDDTEDIALDERDDVGRMPVGMLVPTGALIAVGLTLTVLAGPIVAYSERAAAEVLDRDRYITAVLSEGDADETPRAAGVGAVLADAGVGSVVGQAFRRQHHRRPGGRRC